MIIQNISWNRLLVRFGVCSKECMKGINQGLRVAAPERLWSDLVTDADMWGRQPPFTRMLLGCVTHRPLTSQL